MIKKVQKYMNHFVSTTIFKHMGGNQLILTSVLTYSIVFYNERSNKDVTVASISLKHI